MRVRRIRAVGWRNLAPLDLTLDGTASLNVLQGQNAQGKTNLIEALYALATFRSFRTSQMTDLIERNEREARVAVEVETRDLKRVVELRLAQAGGAERVRGPGGESARRGATRLIYVDDKLVRRASAAFGLVSVVLFVPEDLALARAAPAARRRFVDMAAAGLSPGHLTESATFQRVLRSRNALLRGGGSGGRDLGGTAGVAWLDTLDEQLARAGAKVVVERRRLVAEMGPRVQSFFRALHGDLKVGMVYACDEAVSGARSEEDVGRALLAGLIRRRVVDLKRRHTTFGPQSDDLELWLDGRPAREHASQGQLRSLTLALKLAELALLEARRGEAPILLLDDVPSELDPERRGFLFETVAKMGCQTILSVADPAVVPRVEGRADFLVRSGAVTALVAGQDFPLHPGT